MLSTWISTGVSSGLSGGSFAELAQKHRVAIIEIGANTSTVVIVKDGVPQFVRIISSGGSDLTDAIRSEGSLTTEQAEATKRALGLSTPQRIPVAPENVR